MSRKEIRARTAARPSRVRCASSCRVILYSRIGCFSVGRVACPEGFRRGAEGQRGGGAVTAAPLSSSAPLLPLRPSAPQPLQYGRQVRPHVEYPPPPVVPAPFHSPARRLHVRVAPLEAR